MTREIRGGDPALASDVIANDRTIGWAKHIIPRNTAGIPQRNSTLSVGEYAHPFASATTRKVTRLDYYDSGLIDIRLTPFSVSQGGGGRFSVGGTLYPNYRMDVNLNMLSGAGRRAWQPNDRFKYFTQAMYIFANYGTDGRGDSNVALFDPNDVETHVEGVYVIVPRVTTYSTNHHQRLEWLEDAGTTLMLYLRGNETPVATDTTNGMTTQATIYYRFRSTFESKIMQMETGVTPDDPDMMDNTDYIPTTGEIRHKLNRADQNISDRVSSMRVLLF